MGSFEKSREKIPTQLEVADTIDEQKATLLDANRVEADNVLYETELRKDIARISGEIDALQAKKDAATETIDRDILDHKISELRSSIEKIETTLKTLGEEDLDREGAVEEVKRELSKATDEFKKKLH
ncbi:MAG: hypothetical protein WAZ27_02255 [Minisyncoccia bacterium]